jgi:hypothetical protein
MSGDAIRFRKLFITQWYHPEMRKLNDAARVVYLYACGGPQTTSCGCFRLSPAVAVEDLGGTVEDFETRLQAVCEAFSWAWDPLARVLWIPEWPYLNPPASPNVVRSWARLMANVPDSPVKAEAISDIAGSLDKLPSTFREPWRELSETFPNPKSEPKSRPKSEPKTNQGAGSRETRSESKRAGARRAVAVNEKPDGRNGASDWRTEKLEALARKTLREHPNADEQYLVADFQQWCAANNLGAVPELAALELLHQQRRVS